MNLEEMLAVEGATVIDVREPYEYQSGHVQGSINMPLGSIPEKVSEINAMSKPIVLCCASGGRSGQATMFLNANGVQEAYNGGSWTIVDAVKK